MQQSRATGLSDWRLWRDLRRFRPEGLLGLIDRRQLPHPWGKTSIAALLPRHVQQHLVQLAIAHPLTDRELARMVQVAYHLSVDHRGMRRVLEWHHLSPDVLRHRRQQAPQASLPALSRTHHWHSRWSRPPWRSAWLRPWARPPAPALSDLSRVSDRGAGPLADD